MIPAQLRNKFISSIPVESHVSSFFQIHRFFSASVALETKNAETIALFLKETGFSDAQSKKLLNETRLRFANLETSIKPKISIFQKSGFSNSEIAEIISRAPGILYASATRKVYPSLSTLLSLIDSHQKVVGILRKARWLLTTDMNKTLHPNIEFLKSRGVPPERILRLLECCPTSITVTPHILRKYVEKLESLGINPSSGIFFHGIWAVASLSEQAWELKLRCFMDLGFTESEALAIFRKAPLVFTTSTEKIKRNTEAILATGKYIRSSMTKHPHSFRHSFERRLKPRIQVLQILDDQKLIGKWPKLGVVCSYTDERFHQEYVHPYLKEAGQVLSTVDGISVLT